MNLNNIEIGKKYLILYKVARAARNRKAVMMYLGIEDRLGPIAHSFSARPIAGTQSMPDSWIIEIRDIAQNTQCHLGVKV